MLDEVPDDLIHIMCSFLLPRDIVRVRSLSKQYVNIVSTYLERYKQTTILFDLICPMCGNDWINNRPILPNDFSDIDEDLHYFDIIERQAYVSSLFHLPAKRDHLLCEECEDTLQETPFLSHYKLPSRYQVYIDCFSEYPWVCLIKSNGMNVVWNQYNCIADQSQRQENRDREHDDDWDEESEEYDDGDYMEDTDYAEFY